MSTTTMELVQPTSSLALNQLSEEDRKLVARLKQTYPSHILDAVFQDGFPQGQLSGWDTTASSSRASTASSTLYVASNDGDTLCSSRESRSSNTSFGERGSLWKKRAASVPRHRLSGDSRPRTSRGNSESNETRITLRPRPSQVVSLASIDSVTTPPPRTSSLPVAEISTLFFCTVCERSFQDRSSWQEHEYTVHEQQYYWLCPNDDCDKVFTKVTDFIKHHQADHACGKCYHGAENQRPLPSKRAWACGFDQCKGMFNSWEERCDHVAGHFESLARVDDATSQPSQWKFTNVIRNLLRQADIKDAYKRVMIKTHGEDKVFWPKMRWQAENSTELLRRLEYRDFREGVQAIACAACQLGHPASAEAVKIAVHPVDDTETKPLPNLPANVDFLHIDKFPQPGKNPFDLYGPVPPSPIIQLDFLSDANSDMEVGRTHSSQSSVSQVPYSLYPSPTIGEKEVAFPPAPPKSQAPSILSVTPSEVHSFSSPAEQYPYTTAATWATCSGPAGSENSPPRPKTPSSLLRSAKGLLKKKSAPQMSRHNSIECGSFNSDAATQNIAHYTAS
ncbi:hypothetical protein BT63DRAFT_410077 [Microthyrium microscopicum]|uniref:C2H2-type domain-containing protein n=1 Tax=Microthyrium microscopicum TaxID=703497 RepID=A0A6A6UNE4_9PEZI|nr:hypothetical protein BT63DRAFT_410077 [Microthyrium microscopicum]